MSTNGQLVFTDVDKITFKGVGNTSNAVVDTVTGKIGVGIDNPDANLHVLGNSYVSTNLELGGTLIMGTVNVSAHHSLEAVTAEGNTTPLTIEFSNATTGIVTTGNVEVGKELTVTGNTTVSSNLTVTGNTTVSSNLTVSGNVEVGTANLFVDTVTGNVGIRTTSPGAPFEVRGPDISGQTNGTTSLISRHVAGGDGVLNIFGVLQSNGEETIGLQTQIDGRTFETDITDGWIYSTDTRHTLVLQPYKGNVGIATTTPRTTLHVTDDTDTTGTGDAFISGLTGNTSNRKPTECLRLQGKWHSPGSGALLRFTNQHPQGTFPNAGEYNLAGIAGYDHDNSWGGGLAFYTSPGTGTGGDDLTLRMSIDSTGHVNIPGPTTGANHGPASMLYLLDTGFFKEFSYTNSETPNVKITFNSTSEIPTGAKAVLAEVFLSRDSLSGNGDHQIHVMGKNHTANQQNWLGGAGQPSPTFGNGVDTRQTVEILMPGESDGFTHYFGNWHSSVIIPLENNQIYYSNYGNSSSTGWVYVKIRGYYI